MANVLVVEDRLARRNLLVMALKKKNHQAYGIPCQEYYLGRVDFSQYRFVIIAEDIPLEKRQIFYKAIQHKARADIQVIMFVWPTDFADPGGSDNELASSILKGISDQLPPERN